MLRSEPAGDQSVAPPNQVDRGCGLRVVLQQRRPFDDVTIEPAARVAWGGRIAMKWPMV
jgi:hypothetical protein